MNRAICEADSIAAKWKDKVRETAGLKVIHIKEYILRFLFGGCEGFLIFHCVFPPFLIFYIYYIKIFGKIQLTDGRTGGGSGIAGGFKDEPVSFSDIRLELFILFEICAQFH